MRMGAFPGECFFFAFEKAVDHERAPLARVVAGEPGSFAIDHRWPGIDGYTKCIGKIKLAAVWDLVRVDRAMSRSKSCTVRTRPVPALAGPIDGDPCQDRFIMGKRAACEKRHESTNESQFPDHFDIRFCPRNRSEVGTTHAAISSLKIRNFSSGWFPTETQNFQKTFHLPG